MFISFPSFSLSIITSSVMKVPVRPTPALESTTNYRVQTSQNVQLIILPITHACRYSYIVYTSPPPTHTIVNTINKIRNRSCICTCANNPPVLPHTKYSSNKVTLAIIIIHQRAPIPLPFIPSYPTSSPAVHNNRGIISSKFFPDLLNEPYHRRWLQRDSMIWPTSILEVLHIKWFS